MNFEHKNTNLPPYFNLFSEFDFGFALKIPWPYKQIEICVFFSAYSIKIKHSGCLKPCLIQINTGKRSEKRENTSSK